MKYKKIHIILPLIIISIGLVGIITGNAFNENLTSKVKMLNIFQAYTQFSFIFLGFVYIYLFTEDSIKGTDKYISQLGYSLAVQILFKSLILYAYTLIITTAFIIGYAISINFTDLDYLMLIVCSIAAALLFTITFACLMSIIFKKALDATAFQLNIPWWRSHPIHENRATQSIWTEPCNPLLRATKSTKRATSIYEMTLIFYYLIFE